MGKGYEKVDAIANQQAEKFLFDCKNVVLDGDHITKRKELSRLAKKSGARLLYVRVHAKEDAIIGRLLTARYSKKDFFGGAKTEWGGKNNGGVVAIREMRRRTPWHYIWNNKGGGKWTLKKMPFVFAEIDTSDEKIWKQKVRKFSGLIQKSNR